MSEEPRSVQSTASSGQMTAVMRAVGTAGPKVLRLGLLRGGKVVGERVLRDREAVTVGSNETNLFVVAGEGLPTRFKLFDVKDGRYVLRFTDAMEGRVAMPSGVVELDQLRDRAVYKDGVYRVPLPDEVRGKVTFGDCSFLFQFVAPPAAQPKPHLPVSVTRGAVGIDWTTTMIAAFSFLVHFMAIGAIYSDWLDPVIDYDVNVAQLVEQVKALPPPPEVEQKNVEAEKDKAADEKPVDAEPKPTPKKAVDRSEPTSGKLSAAQVASLSKELDSFDMGILGANLGNTATADVLSGSDDIATSVMDQAAASGAGVSGGGPGGLKLGAAGGAIRPGADGSSLSSIGSTGKAADEGSGKVAAIKGPTGHAQVGGASVAGGRVTDAARAVARMKGGASACYRRGQAQNPDIAGRIDLRLKVGPGGEVVGVSATVSGNLPQSVVSCVKERARSVRFSPPEGGSAVVSVPFSFVKQ